ncbi:MAG: tRNA(Ile)-lysidine synthase [Oceanospirillaceae bacterium]|jgi:tRNA(Ile)-lysidine synthase
MSITQSFLQQCQSVDVSNANDRQEKLVKRWVIALSGGLDSMVTLDLASKLLPQNSIVAIHVNHQLQSAADDWQNFCVTQCALREIPLYSFKISVKGSSEQQLRDARYQCFESFLEAGDYLLFGHHANDQAETLLFRLVRGAGTKGLSAMPLQRAIGKAMLLRPLLQLDRSSLEDYANQQQLNWIEDPSNQSIDYDRNFIRHKVLNPLKQHWPKASEQIALCAHTLAIEQQLLAGYLALDIQQISQGNVLDLVKWQQFESNKAIVLLRHWLINACASHVSRKQLQRILQDVIASRSDSRGYCKIGAYTIKRFKRQLYIIKTDLVIEPWPKLSLQLQLYNLNQGSLSFRYHTQGIRFKPGMYLQCKNEGMTIEVAGRGRKKLKKLFQESAIAPWLRENWPLLMYDEAVVAVPGICVCEGWLEQGQKKSYLSIDWHPL